PWCSGHRGARMPFLVSICQSHDGMGTDRAGSKPTNELASVPQNAHVAMHRLIGRRRHRPKSIVGTAGCGRSRRGAHNTGAGIVGVGRSDMATRTIAGVGKVISLFATAPAATG